MILLNRCRICGCHDDQPCELERGGVCFWLDAEHTLCSNPRCVAVVPLAELESIVLFRDPHGNQWHAGELPQEPTIIVLP